MGKKDASRAGEIVKAAKMEEEAAVPQRTKEELEIMAKTAAIRKLAAELAEQEVTRAAPQAVEDGELLTYCHKTYGNCAIIRQVAYDSARHRR